MLWAKESNQLNFSKKGKYSNIKKPNICNWPVKIANPVNNRIDPPNLFIIGRYFLKFFETVINLSSRIPDIIKGIAKPSE